MPTHDARMMRLYRAEGGSMSGVILDLIIEIIGSAAGALLTAIAGIVGTAMTGQQPDV